MMRLRMSMTSMTSVLSVMSVGAAVLAAGMVAHAQTVTIDSGKLHGASAGGVETFKGIPYAAPPVGELRWRDPQPVAPWTNVREATAFGPDCEQALGKNAGPGGNFAEGCLFLNVWRPAKMTPKTPVMLWIHGGGFTQGGSSRGFDGTEFARRGVILVTINYRLGRFGFFGFPALTAAAGKDEVLGNYAFADQIAALKWVQRNIAAFGGDPNVVTIFGESAGGGSVQALLCSPLAKGLFARAIVESGGGRAGGLVSADHGIAAAEEKGVAFAKENSIAGTDAAALAKLRALPAETVRGDLTMGTSRNETATFIGPMIDGKLVLGYPDQIYAAGGGARVPLMIGATNMDARIADETTAEALWASFGSFAAQAKAIYDPTGTTDLRVLRELVGSDRQMVEPARFASKVYSSEGLPTYEYRFSYVPEALRATVKGAKHASELAFVFDSMASGPRGKTASASDLATADTMNAYWAAFGRTGDPNGDGRPVWPKYSEKTDMLLDFTNAGPKPEADPWKARLDVMQAAEDAAAARELAATKK